MMAVGRPTKRLELKPVYTVLELAQSLGIRRRTFIQLLEMHEVLVYRIGRTVVVRLDSAAGGRLPDDTFGRAAFDLRSADRLTAALARDERSLLVPLVSCARSLLRDAVVAYARARGGHERPVVRGIL